MVTVSQWFQYSAVFVLLGYLTASVRLLVSRDNLRQIVGEYGGEEYIDQLIAEADFLHDGKISYAEFLQAFNQRNKELVYNLYELERDESRHSSELSLNSDDEVLRHFGIMKTIRRAFNSSEALQKI